MDNSEKLNNKVSLPGAGSETGEPSLLKSLNKELLEGTVTGCIKSDNKDNVIIDHFDNNIDDDNDDYNSTITNIIINNNNTIEKQSSLDNNNKIISDSDSTIKPNPSQTKQILDKVFDIESHLIETIENYSVNDDNENNAILINELQPADDELSKTSIIESETSPKTIIEIEPAVPKVFQSIKTEIDANEPQIGLSTTALVNSQLIDQQENQQHTKDESSSHIENNNLKENNLEKLNVQLEAEGGEINLLNNDKIVIEQENSNTEKELKIEETDEVDKQISQNANLNKSTVPVELNSNKNQIDEKSGETHVNLLDLKVLEKELQKILGNDRDTSEDRQKTDVNKNSQPIETIGPENSSIAITNPTIVDTNENCAAESFVPCDLNLNQNGTYLEELKTDSVTDDEQILSNSSLSENLKTTDNSPNVNNNKDNNQLTIDINGLPLPSTPLEEEEKKKFLESIPQLEAKSNSEAIAKRAKKEYYQSLRKYLVDEEENKPPVPLQTYRWEDLRRARERGGYPWTHIYKRPLGPDEEPEIVLLLRKSQELRFASESPKSLKKVRIHDKVLVKETERYIQDLATEKDDLDNTDDQIIETEEEDCHSLRSESVSCVSDSVLTVETKKTKKLSKLRGILKRRGKKDIQSSPESTSSEPQQGKSEESPKKSKCCHPIMDKLKSMADKHVKKRNIKTVSLKKGNKIDLTEEQKIIKLKTSPKAKRSEIPHFIEKQDSDDILEIVELDESPSRKRLNHLEGESSVLVPDEIIEIPIKTEDDKLEKSEETVASVQPIVVTENLDQELKKSPTIVPRKAPRLRREHVYEDIEDDEDTLSAQINNIIELASVEALKKSLAAQDKSYMKEFEAAHKSIPLDRMGSSEEEVEKSSQPVSLLAPISSIDSTSSDEERVTQLSPVAEESDIGSFDGVLTEKESADVVKIVSEHENKLELLKAQEPELKPALKREVSPSPSDKKVTFSHVEDEAEPHREDIELPDEIKAATSNRWTNMADHEYEPIGEPKEEELNFNLQTERESSPAPVPTTLPSQSPPTLDISTPMEAEEKRELPLPDDTVNAQELQKDIEERYFSSGTITPRTDSRTDYEIQTSQVDTSDLEELPLKPEKKSFMANAQDRGRKMQAGLRTQAGKIRTKFRGMKKPPRSPRGSPKDKERKRFKAPEFSKIKMPEMKRPEMPKFKTPDMSKLKDFKRPEFTKFNKPDMSKFKIPEKFSSLKLTRSKSFKEPEEQIDDASATTPESTSVTPAATVTSPKKKFEFNFGTYPRVLRRKKKDTSMEVNLPDELPSVVTSTETPPSVESSSIQQGDRGPGPVRSRWADKFSDVSYGGSDTSRFQRFGSEQESFDRESSMERRMRDDLEQSSNNVDDLDIIPGVEQKQFAEFDEENRAIHEISEIRSKEFKRRPLVHQDSDLVSEESKDLVGWSERDIMKNKMLRRAEIDTEGYNIYPSEEGLTGSVNTNQETQSTGSSIARKGVIEEIDDDEFFLRKRGISQDNIEIRQYISTAIREGFDTPKNALAQLGRDEYTDSMLGIDNEQMGYGYDIPPPKPRRVKNYNNFESADVSQEFEPKGDYDDNISLPHTGSDYMRNAAPGRPLRKGRKQFSDSQEVPDSASYFEEMDRQFYEKELAYNRDFDKEPEINVNEPPPKAPKRRKRQTREPSDKDSYINGFGGRSVSNSYLQSDNQPEDVIVYRVEHEYIPLATPENLTEATSTPPRKSRSRSRLRGDDDDRTSRGADSLMSDALHAVDIEDNEETNEKFTIEMTETDGYAIVRKEHQIPKPTPPARRKKFSRSPGERFATMPNPRQFIEPSPEPPKRNYSTIGPSKPPRRKSLISLDETQKMISNPDVSQYEELEFADDLPQRAESPRDLHSGDVVNKMKFRPLPPPPRPPREKRQRPDQDNDNFDNKDDRDGGGERIVVDYSESSEYDEDKIDGKLFEVEVSTQTDPLPDDFVCEEFEITDDMKVIEPRRSKTLADILKEEQEAEIQRTRQELEDENLSRGLQRFREANQRTLSERSRASSQADRSKSLSRPQTPSAILIEKRVPTPIPYGNETMLEASLTVQPILNDLDLEEEALRREGLVDGSSTKSDAESRLDQEEEQRLTTDHSHEESLAHTDERLSEVESQRETEKSSELEEDDAQASKWTSNAIHYDWEDALRYDPRSEIESDDQIESQAVTPKKEEEAKKSGWNTQSSKSEEEEAVLRELEEWEAQVRQRTKRSAPQPPVPEQAPDFEYELENEKDITPPPIPPPRRRSSATEQEVQPIIVEALPPTVNNAVSSLPTQPSSAHDVLASLPTHLAIADLEVERLRVHALQAGQIMVSELHGAQINADELECRSGNLIVKNIELPPGFIEEIVERVRSTERDHAQIPAETQTIETGDRPSQHTSLTKEETEKRTVRSEDEPPPIPPPPQSQVTTQIEQSSVRPPPQAETQIDEPPVRPPPPQQHTVSPSDYMHSNPPASFFNLQNPDDPIQHRLPPTLLTSEYLQSIPPASFFNLRNPDEDDHQPTQVHRRRRHHRRHDSSSEDEHRRHRSRSRPEDPSVVQAGRQLFSACNISLVRLINSLTNSLRMNGEKEGNDRTVGTMIAVFIIITLGFLFLALSGKDIHHHHWDFFNPPGNSGST